MATTKKEKLERLKKEVIKCEKKTFKVMFFVMDTKGVPTGTLSYIYETAYMLKELGYNVSMLHTEAEFVGVEDWLGEKYAMLPHYNIEKDNVDVSPADFLFIPEIYSNVMSKTKELPCKRVAILHNFRYANEIIPIGATWDDLGIRDCVTVTDELSTKIKECFPHLRTFKVRQSVSELFTTEDKPKKLIVNVVSKNQSQVNSVLKPFLWKFPIYKWVSFRNLNGVSKEDYAKALKESAITLWLDDVTDCGISALESMACGTIVIGKIPESKLAWMQEDNKFKHNGLWFYTLDECYQLLANTIESFIEDGIPEEFYEEMKTTVSNFTVEQQLEEINDAYVNGLFASRHEELKAAYDAVKYNEEEKD